MSAPVWVGRVVIATRNPGKLRELQPMLADAGWEAIDLRTAGLPEDPAAESAIEAFESFEENALAKARHFAGLLPGAAVLADDSGLAVTALGGAPGVRSKRWSERHDLEGAALDAANNARLLAALAGRPERRARYVCAAAWVHGAVELVRTGEVWGEIVAEPRGAEGFGYDPYFLADELGRTFGESRREDKARISHRARAVAALLAAVRALGGDEGRGQGRGAVGGGAGAAIGRTGD